MRALNYFIGAMASLAVNAAQASCMNYGPTSLTGTVVQQTYAGPPDYESVTKGDQPIVIFLLQLDRTLCLIDSALVAQHTREIQLEWSAGGAEPLRNLLGKKVTFRGELIRGAARHDKRVVLVATELTN